MYENLSTKTVKELRTIAVELGITGRWDMKKSELIEAIEMMQDAPQQTKSTYDYLAEAEKGTLVAFTRGNNKDIAMSGKFMGMDGNKVLVESKLGTVFKLNPENIIWVKTVTRWPRWVFSLFSKKESEAE